MAKAIFFHPLAEEELIEAHGWYFRRSPKAGDRFQAEIDAALITIAERPQSFPAYLRGARRCLLKRFPYLVVFIERDKDFHIIAVAHGRRKPGYWSDRV